VLISEIKSANPYSCHISPVILIIIGDGIQPYPVNILDKFCHSFADHSLEHEVILFCQLKKAADGCSTPEYGFLIAPDAVSIGHCPEDPTCLEVPALGLVPENQYYIRDILIGG